MKLNKKLLMAALAGAIVVGGGVSTYAEEPSNQFTDHELKQSEEQKTEESNQFTAPEYKATTKEEKQNELKAAKEAALAKLERLGITNPMIKKQIENAKTSAGLDSLVETVVKSHAESNPDKVQEEEPEYSNLFTDHKFVFRTKEQAEYAAKKAIKDEELSGKQVNHSYEVVQTADGNWDYVLSTEEKKSEEKKPEENPSTPEVTPTPGRQPSTPEGPYAPYEPSTPGKEEKEDKKPEDKKPGEDKKPEDKKPGEDKKPETKKPEKENTDSPNKKKKEKAALPKAGSEAEILTLAAAALSTAAGAFVSLKKRK